MNDLNKEIQLYIDGEMTPDEKKSFEEKIKANPELEKEIASSREMSVILNENDWEVSSKSLKNKKITTHETFLRSDKGKMIAGQIDEAANDYFSSKSQTTLKQKIYYVGGIAAILILGFFSVIQLNTTDTDALYAEYKNWDELPSLTSRNGNNSLGKIEKLFRSKQYANALTLLNNIEKTPNNKVNTQTILYKGAIYLELEDTNNAIKEFKKLADSHTLDAFKAHWYLALTHLKNDDKKKAIIALETLLKDEYTYKDEAAKKILDKLQ